ncbi:N-acetyltransferase [Photobacterium gaetbulicola]|uniref:Putative GCN5-related N-acetyltransferase n=1 Tax=Photobacterium gaetbulicola Gung47 TaxID=658445 RepID=A0A0C5WI23_9GAMM|nr:GNAT family N-acetyltransferase [Photobacterium gaetbulicola]AJR06763.1 putative GCN5-related N-acetyltransferase [Photobacterium gaetbulicola Gung47]PSU14077.1 N-acetyltransferase [Photobacterium gaetbulicola]
MKIEINFSTERLSVKTLDRTMPGIQDEIMTMFTEPVSRHLPPSCQNFRTAEDVANWLEGMARTGSVLRLTLQQQAVGYLFVFPEPEDCYRLGYVLDEAQWGKGLATEAMLGLVNYLSAYEHAACFIAGVEPDNTGSVNVLKKLGFSYSYSEQDVDYYKLQSA